MKGREDLSLLHTGTHQGGTFGEVRVFASTTFTGPIDCETLTIYDGEAMFEKNVRAKRVIIKGKAIFHATLTALSIEANGKVKTDGDVKTNRLIVKDAFLSTAK